MLAWPALDCVTNCVIVLFASNKFSQPKRVCSLTPAVLKWHQYLKGAVVYWWYSSQFRTSRILYWAGLQRSCSGCSNSLHIIYSLILSNPPDLMVLHCANQKWANQNKERFCPRKNTAQDRGFLSSQLQLITMVCLMCLMSLRRTNMCSLWRSAGCRLEARLDDIVRR